MRVLYTSVSVLTLLIGCAKAPAPSSERGPGKLSREYLQSEYQRDRARFSSNARKEIPPLDVQSYALKGRFDWQAGRLEATVDVTLKRLDPAQTRVVLDSRVDVHDVKVGDKKVPFTIKDDLLTIDLALLPRNVIADVMMFTISYSASADVAKDGDQSSLVSVSLRNGDPLQARTVATHSEPLGASEWMPCHNVPSDRALFSAEFEMPEKEALISNGDLLFDEVKDGTRRTAYATRYSIPTYLMAWALGDFEQTTWLHGNLPISVWRRKGVPIDANEFLTHISTTMSLYERLLGAFPFEKYAVVLLPEYTGGIENAGITFQGEVTSTHPMIPEDRALSAHELGHQWYGDLMTVRTWDDLWIKEGMATLLAEEADRQREDINRTGRLFGSDFAPKSGDAIRDPSLPPDEKYTTGPYDRAAWLYSQLRSALGEDTFWSILRSNLQKHAFGSVGTDEFLESFHAALGDSTFERVKLAVKAKALPRLEVGTDASQTPSLRVVDTEMALVLPIEMRWYEEIRRFKAIGALTNGMTTRLERQGKHELLVIDPQDRHPLPSFIVDKKAFATHVLPYFVPETGTARTVFFSVSASHQSEALTADHPWQLSPATFRLFFSTLGSDEARYRALQVACRIAARPGESRLAWKESLGPIFRAANPGLVRTDSGRMLSECRPIVGEDFFNVDWASLIERPGEWGVKEPRLDFMLLLSTDTSTAFRAARALVTGGASVRSRMMGVRLLSQHLSGAETFERPPANDLPEWKGFLHEILGTYDPSEIVVVALKTAGALKDKEAIPALALGVKHVRRPELQRKEVCLAAKLAAGDTDAWNGFVKAVGDSSRLPGAVRAVLSDPSECGLEK